MSVFGSKWLFRIFRGHFLGGKSMEKVHALRSAVFADKELGYWDKARVTFGDVELPKDTFRWHPRNPSQPMDNVWNIKNVHVSCFVPIIPTRILPIIKHSLKNYHILWEVDHWIPEPPKDPILLKQLTPNLFAVLATWDLTPLERAVIRGRL